MINRIEITVISHEKQRYDTCGDWQVKGDLLEINISDLGCFGMNMLVAIHELIESSLCCINGVTSDQVDNYDFSHEDAGNANLDSNQHSPYFVFHNDATSIEWILSRMFGVDWKEYSRDILHLGEK